MSSSSRIPTDRLTPEQSEIWWCDVAGLEHVPTEPAIRAEFVAAGVPELCPDDEFWARLRRNPGYPWILAPGANPRGLDPEHFGRPAIYRMEGE